VPRHRRRQGPARVEVEATPSWFAAPVIRRPLGLVGVCAAQAAVDAQCAHRQTLGWPCGPVTQAALQRAGGIWAE
jgi:hypothetical protein